MLLTTQLPSASSSCSCVHFQLTKRSQHIYRIYMVNVLYTIGFIHVPAIGKIFYKITNVHNCLQVELLDRRIKSHCLLHIKIQQMNNLYEI